MRVRGKNISEELGKEICARYLSGNNAYEVASYFGVVPTIVYYQLKKFGFKSRGRKLITEEIGREIRQRYLDGENAYEVGKYFGVHPASVYNQLKKVGLSSRENKKLFTDEQVLSICKEYKEGSSKQNLATLYNVSQIVIKRLLKENGICLRSISEAKTKYTLDHNSFKVITPESAYWIGFLMADGCIYYDLRGKYTQPRISVALNVVDKDHLEKFLKFLKFSGTALNKSVSRGNIVQISVTSQKLVDDLAKYNVLPRKSFTATAPSSLVYNRDFWRGVCDGDGWIKYKEECSTQRRSAVYITGSKNITDQFKLFVCSLVPTCANVLKTKTVYCFGVKGIRAQRVIKVLYEDSIVSLDRKQELANKIIKDNGFSFRKYTEPYNYKNYE